MKHYKIFDQDGLLRSQTDDPEVVNDFVRKYGAKKGWGYGTFYTSDGKLTIVEFDGERAKIYGGAATAGWEVDD